MSAQPEVLDRPTEATAITEYSQTAAGLADLRKRFDGVQFDVATTAGDKAARSARLELVTLRTSLEAKRKAIKAPLLEQAALIDSEAKRLTASILALENPIHEQIKNDEARRAAAKAEAERIEAERKAAEQRLIDDQKAAILRIQQFPSRAFIEGASAVERLLADLQSLPVTEFLYPNADLLAEANAAKIAAVDVLATIYQAKLTAEKEAKRLREESAALAAQKAAQDAEAAAERKRIVDEQKAAAAAEEARLRTIREAQEAELAQQRAKEAAERAERDRVEAAERKIEQDKIDAERAELEKQREVIAVREREARRIEQEKAAEELAKRTAAEQAERERVAALHAKAEQLFIALRNLTEQITKTNPVDDHGHNLKMNKAYIDAVELLAEMKA